MICKAFRDPDTTGFIEKTVAQQRALVAPIGATLLYWAWQCGLLFRQGYFAREIQRRLNTRKKGTKDTAEKADATAASVGKARPPRTAKQSESTDATAAA